MQVVTYIEMFCKKKNVVSFLFCCLKYVYVYFISLSPTDFEISISIISIYLLKYVSENIYCN